MNCIFCRHPLGEDDIGDRRAVTCCELAVAMASDSETVEIMRDDLVDLSGRLHRAEQFLRYVEDGLEAWN